MHPHTPLDPPLPALITMTVTTTPTSRFGFSMMGGKFCHSYFEITARTALAQFGHFTLKTRIRFQKRQGFDPLISPHPLGAPLEKVWLACVQRYLLSPKRAWRSGSERRFYDDHDRKVDGSPPNLVSLLRPRIRCFTMIISAWWNLASSKLKKSEENSSGKLGNKGNS